MSVRVELVPTEVDGYVLHFLFCVAHVAKLNQSPSLLGGGVEDRVKPRFTLIISVKV